MATRALAGEQETRDVAERSLLRKARLLKRLREAIRKGGLTTRRRLATCPTLAILLACCPYASALDPSLDVSQYAHTAWKTREGFATGIIHQIAQTPDGYLWLASESGLLRFDGVRTVPWQPGPGERLPSNDIQSVIAARDGTLWLGTAKGLVSLKNGKLIQYPELDGYDACALLEDHEGTVWAGAVASEQSFTRPGRLCAIKTGKISCHERDGNLGFGVTAIHEDRQGNLWLGAGSGLWRWKPGPPTKYALPLPENGTPSLTFSRNALIDDEHGGLIISEFKGITHLTSGRAEPYPIPAPRKISQAGLLRDRDGGLWIGTLDAGLLHLHQGRVDLFSQSDGLSGGAIESLFEDQEGSIWVTTANGIDRFHEYAIPTISEKQGLSSPNVLSVVAARDGSVWLGTTDGLNRWNHGQVTIYRKPDGADTRGPSGNERFGHMVQEVSAPALPQHYIGSLFEDTRGRIWIAAPKGLSYFENGRISRLTDLPVNDLNAIIGDSKGNLWIAEAERGLARLRDGKLVERIPWDKLGIRGTICNPLLADSEDEGVWVGSWSGGVVWFRNGQVRAHYGSKEGLGTGRVNSLQPDHEGGLWAATDGGLSHIKDGNVTTMTSNNGLPCDTVQDLIEDDARSLWVYTACGLVRIAKPDLVAWATDPKRRIQVRVFDASDGIQGHSGVLAPTPRVARTPDGRLWFLPRNGVSVVDTHHLPSNKLPPPVHVEEVKVDGKDWDASHGWRLPALTRDLEIHYTALSLVAPEKNHFKYKLEGRDSDWKDAGNERKASYTDLPPRNYRFRVIASNNNAVWNETGAALEFSIPPAYYQTTWFQASCVAALLALLWGLYRYRLHQMAREFNANLEGRVDERTRIARDLHDTLLQSFQGLVLRFQVVDELLPARPGEAKDALDKALEKADQAIVEGRDAVHDLRSSTEVTNDLGHAVKALGDELASADSAKFHLAIEGSPRNLHPILRDEVYRIAREAVRNAFSHAQARKIEAEITYGERLLRLRIRDDGRGMDPEIVEEGRDGHYGLPGMRERAKRIGGQLNIWTGAGAGTEIELSIPGSIAYGKPATRWWHWLRPDKATAHEEEI